MHSGRHDAQRPDDQEDAPSKYELSQDIAAQTVEHAPRIHTLRGGHALQQTWLVAQEVERSERQ